MKTRFIAFTLIMINAFFLMGMFVQVNTFANYDYYDDSRDYSNETEQVIVDGQTATAVSTTTSLTQAGMGSVQVSGADTYYDLSIQNDTELGRNVLVSRAESTSSTQSNTTLTTTQLVPYVSDGSTGNSTAIHMSLNFANPKDQQFYLRAEFRDGGVVSGSMAWFKIIDINWISGMGTFFNFGDNSSDNAADFVENQYQRWTDFSRNTWYDFVILFNDLGDASQDSYEIYVDGELMFTRVGLPKDFNQSISFLKFVQYQKTTDLESNTLKIGEILTSNFNPVSSVTANDQTMDAGSTVEADYVLTKVDPNYDATLGLKNVTISDPTVLSFDRQTSQLTAALVESQTTVNVTYEAYDQNGDVITDTAAVTIEPLVVDILPTSIEQVELLGTIEMSVGQTYDLSGLVQVLPETTTDKSLSYALNTGSSVSLSGSSVTAIDTGQATVTVTANADTNVTKLLTIEVKDGIHQGLNDFLPETVGSAHGDTLTDHWVALGYSKEFGVVETATDSIFGSKLVVNGAGTVANAGGSYADGTFTVSELGLQADHDYYLSGYFRIDGASLGSQRADIKVYVMKDTGDGSLGAIDQAAPFYQILQFTNASVSDQGWIYFETGAFNLDSYADASALNFELISYNNDENVTVSFAGLSLVPKDSVDLVDVKAYIGSEFAGDQTINVGDTLQVNGQSVPSTAITTFTYASSDDNIVTIDENGLVTAIAAGTATITVSAESRAYTFDVTVENPIQSIAVDQSDLTLEISQNQTVLLTINPQDYVDTLVFDFSIAGVASYTLDGTTLTVIPQSIGSTVLTISSQNDSTVQTSINIEVTDVSVTAVDIYMDESVITSLELNIGDEKDLTVTVSPVTRIDKTYTVVIGDETVVTLDENNTLKALKAGTTTIEFTVDGVTTSLTVEVLEDQDQPIEDDPDQPIEDNPDQPDDDTEDDNSNVLIIIIGSIVAVVVIGIGVAIKFRP